MLTGSYSMHLKSIIHSDFLKQMIMKLTTYSVNIRFAIEQCYVSKLYKCADKRRNFIKQKRNCRNIFFDTILCQIKMLDVKLEIFTNTSG